MQYDVFENPNVAQRIGFPFLVVLQSDQLDHYATRLVMPLARLAKKPSRLPRRLAQVIEIAGEQLYPAAHLTAALPLGLLRRPVESLRERPEAIRDALDAVLSGV